MIFYAWDITLRVLCILQVYGKTYTSMDAGHYLCDFIYYCSMAEAQRATEPSESEEETNKNQIKIPGPFGPNRHPEANNRVFFLHCPPQNLPYSTEEVTEAIRRIVIWLGSQRLPERCS
jgi:pyroglutamyl-peptidase